MARSVKWPFVRTARGGLALTDDTDGGQEELRQIVVLAHLPGPSGSAWGKQKGIGAPESAFGLSGDPSMAAPAVMHSRAVFRRLEAAGRARLLPGFPQVRREATTDGGGRTVIAIEFVDLESGQPQRVAVPSGRR